MAAKKDELDILTVFIAAMLLFTVLAGGFAGIYYRRVSATTAQVKREVGFLNAMFKLAQEEDLRGWIVKEREGQQVATSRSSADFKALYLKLSREHALSFERETQLQSIQQPGVEEIPFQMVIRRCRVESLIKFLVKIEEQWPGARVKKIDKLQYSERGEQKGWDATVIVSIFNAKD